MKISIAERRLMKMLFELGTVDQIGGAFKEGFTERRWDIIRRPKNRFRDAERFDVLLSGYYARSIGGETLDEALKNLEDVITELIEEKTREVLQEVR